jgi:exopolyphosphatase/guanosine-5'-triphosphate,3'-diphosphate pyrophosphatase
MDIGGGSVELIQITDGQMTWKQSFPIGNALLTRAYHHSDPISSRDQQALTQYLEQTLAPFWERWQNTPPILVGAAGTFEVIAKACSPYTTAAPLSPIDLTLWDTFFHKVITSTRADRVTFTQIPDERVDYIVSALLLVQQVIHKGKVHTWYASAHSLKEGLLQTLIEEHTL